MRIVPAAAAVIAVAVVILLVPWYRGYMKQINFRTCMRARRKVCIDVREMKKEWKEGELPDKDTQIEFFLQAVENLPTEVSEPKLESEEDGILKFTCTGLCKEGGITTFFLNPETGELYGDCSLEEHLQGVHDATSYNQW